MIQQSAETVQRADIEGNWHRLAAAGIVDKSLTREIEALDNHEQYSGERREISGHSATEVGGMFTVEAGLVTWPPCSRSTWPAWGRST